MTASIDWSRAEIICGQLMAAYKEKSYPYGEDWALPQSFIPEEIKADPQVHALFLFGVCHYMRGTIKSEHAVRQLVKMWQKTPLLFDPDYVSKLGTHVVLVHVLGSYISYRKEEIGLFWYKNMLTLQKYWNGDPRKLFAGEMTSEIMYRRIRGSALSLRNRTENGETHKGFHGFQKKMASMLAYFLMDVGLVDSFTASPPVDFHLIRILLATGVLVTNGREGGGDYRYEHLEPLGVQVLEKYAVTHEVSLVEIGNALWMLSVVLCSLAPGNRSTAVRRGDDGKKIYPVPIPVDWTVASNIIRYLDSCGRCPIQSHCSLNVFSGPYYQEGKLIFLPRENLPSIDTPLFGEMSFQSPPGGISIRSARATDSIDPARSFTQGELDFSDEVLDARGKVTGQLSLFAPER